jgi:hypothetical protein
MNLEQVTFTGAQETALATLYGKAMESQRPDSILGDRVAYDAVQRIDYEFSKFRIRRRHEKALAIRAKAYDGWVRRFLDTHPVCTVLHLGCGLDTRVYRVNPPSTVYWYDIDLPDVIELRQRLFLEPQDCTRSPPRSPIRTCSTRSPATHPCSLLPKGCHPTCRPPMQWRCCDGSPNTFPAAKWSSIALVEKECGLRSAPWP